MALDRVSCHFDVHTVLEPTESVRGAATAIYDGVGRFFRARHKAKSFARYEAYTEAYNLLSMVGRSLEAIAELASRDLVMYAGAAAVARSAFESSVRTMWLLHPSNVFESEARYLAHLREEEELCRREADLIRQLGGNIEPYDRTRETIRRFRELVTAKLPSGVDVPTRVPTLRDILRSLDLEAKYLYYMHLSQISHGSHRGAGVYREHLGTEKVLGERVTPGDWGVLFAASWYPFAEAAQMFMTRTSSQYYAFGESTYPERVDGLVRAVLGISALTDAV